jgi:hypothetical protein
MQDTLKYIKESPYIKEVQYSVYAISKIEKNDNINSIESYAIENGLFVGGIANPLLNEKIFTVDDLARAYYREMLVGNVFDLPSKEFVKKFREAYEEATTQI